MPVPKPAKKPPPDAQGAGADTSREPAKREGNGSSAASTQKAAPSPAASPAKPAQPDKAVIEKLVKYDDWNEYVIRCEGPRIRLWLNGKPTVDYTEEDEKIEKSGIIGLQIHGGAKAKVYYKDITIEELPAKK